MIKRARGIKLLIDEGHKKQKQIDELNIELDEIKRKIKNHAKATENRQFKGYSSKVIVGDWSQSYIHPFDVWKVMSNPISDFFKVVKIIQNKLKNYLSDEEIDKIKKTDTIKFHTVRFVDD